MKIKHNPIRHLFNKMAEYLNTDDLRVEWGKLAREEKDKIIEEFINKIK